MNDLARRLSKGDADAYSQLYDACADRLFAYVTMRLASPHEAADVIQETFMRLARSSRQFKSISDPVAYVFMVARNETNRWLARRQREREGRRTLSELPPRNETPEPVEKKSEKSESLAVALGRLDANQREIVELRFHADLTFAEIAVVLATPQGTVASRYRAALARLRDCLEREAL